LREDLIQGELFAGPQPLLLLLLGTLLSLLCQSVGRLGDRGYRQWLGRPFRSLLAGLWRQPGIGRQLCLAGAHALRQIALMQVLQKFAGFAAVLWSP
jgi:hypothetical protein